MLGLLEKYPCKYSGTLDTTPRDQCHSNSDVHFISLFFFETYLFLKHSIQNFLHLLLQKRNRLSEKSKSSYNPVTSEYFKVIITQNYERWWRCEYCKRCGLIVRIPWFFGVYDWDVNGRDEVGDLDLALNCSTIQVWK